MVVYKPKILFYKNKFVCTGGKIEKLLRLMKNKISQKPETAITTIKSPSGTKPNHFGPTFSNSQILLILQPHCLSAGTDISCHSKSKTILLKS